jgi:hypothetical protein
MIASTIYNVNKGRDAPFLGPDDFLSADPAEQQQRKAADLSAQIKAALGGRG